MINKREEAIITNMLSNSNTKTSLKFFLQIMNAFFNEEKNGFIRSIIFIKANVIKDEPKIKKTIKMILKNSLSNLDINKNVINNIVKILIIGNIILTVLISGFFNNTKPKDCINTTVNIIVTDHKILRCIHSNDPI